MMIEDQIDSPEILIAAEEMAAVEKVSKSTGLPNVPTVNYSDPEWIEVNTVEEMERFYHSRLPAIREAARKCGYAIGLHGSCRRDFDLMAMPWIDIYATPDALAREVMKAACGFTQSSHQWERKPNGRIATSLPICWASPEIKKGKLSVGHIDLSVMASAAPPPPVSQRDDDKLWEVAHGMYGALHLAQIELFWLCKEHTGILWDELHESDPVRIAYSSVMKNGTAFEALMKESGRCF